MVEVRGEKRLKENKVNSSQSVMLECNLNLSVEWLCLQKPLKCTCTSTHDMRICTEKLKAYRLSYPYSATIFVCELK